MRIHFLNVGHGDMTLIEFDGVNVLIDSNIAGKEDSAYKYIENTIGKKGTIDYLIITHPDKDHIRGLKTLDENFVINKIWESGFRRNDIDKMEKSKESEEIKDLYNTFIKLVEEKESEQLIASGKQLNFTDKNVKAYCLCSKSEKDNEDIHYNSLVIKFVKDGKSVLFTGDSNCEAWKQKVVDNYESLLESDILHASHHGSRTFFYENGQDYKEESPYTDALEEISPSYTVISGCDKDDKVKETWPPHDDAVELYEEYTSRDGGVYITGRDDNMVFDLTDGNLSINEDFTSENVFKNFKKGKRAPKLRDDVFKPSPCISVSSTKQPKVTWG